MLAAQSHAEGATIGARPERRAFEPGEGEAPMKISEARAEHASALGTAIPARRIAPTTPLFAHRPLPTHTARTGVTPLPATDEAPASIFFASIEAVRRTLGINESLDMVELACGATYTRQADRERYFAARMLLRHALSKAVDGRIAPSDWRYREGAHGKPMMAGGLPALQFNVSHSEDCVAVAVSRNQPIGIDIEAMQPESGPGIIQDVLSEGERNRLANVPPSQQWFHFIRMWTAKEAAAKALGLGLSLDFSTIDVILDPLRVRLLYPPVGTPTKLDAAAKIVTKDGKPYVLTMARVVG
jgi:4'-phosphopantetheinyl transferase